MKCRDRRRAIVDGNLYVLVYGGFYAFGVLPFVKRGVSVQRIRTLTL